MGTHFVLILYLGWRVNLFTLCASDTNPYKAMKKQTYQNQMGTTHAPHGMNPELS